MGREREVEGERVSIGGGEREESKGGKEKTGPLPGASIMMSRCWTIRPSSDLSGRRVLGEYGKRGRLVGDLVRAAEMSRQRDKEREQAVREAVDARDR